jgi:hypothetical protein
MAKYRRLWDTYRFPGFRPEPTVSGIFGDSKARVIRLVRKEKKQRVVRAALFTSPITTKRPVGFGTCPAGICGFSWKWKSDGFFAAGAKK